MLTLDTYHLKITFRNPILGSQPPRDVASAFLAKRFVDNGGELPADELEGLPETLERGTTVFHRNPAGAPVLIDYQVKGFIKEAGRVFNGLEGINALRSKIENLVFVQQRMIELHIPEGGCIEYMERPLRAETAQGPRVGLARSEMLPAGTWLECDLEVFPGKAQISEDMLRDLLTYGARKGLGQWRNAGFGAFDYELTATGNHKA